MSFDNEGIGKAIADSLVAQLKADGVKADDGAGVLQINGSPTDAAAGLIKKGIHAGLDTSGYPDPGRIRHAGLGAAEGAAMGKRPDHPLPGKKSSASWPPMTAPAAAPSPPSRRPASTRFRR